MKNSKPYLRFKYFEIVVLFKIMSLWKIDFRFVVIFRFCFTKNMKTVEKKKI